jgi:hypothetical protein
MNGPVESGEDRELRQSLRALRVEPADEGAFSASLHRRLVATGQPEEPSPWRRLRWRLGEQRALWPALGAAAAVLLAVVAGPWPGAAPGPTRNGNGNGVAASLPATKVAVVRVNLSAEVAVESAEIRVSLPEGLVFWAEGRELAQRSFEWSQPLRAGDNDIPIAVRGLRPGRYRMTVTAQIGDQHVEDHVLLQVVDG